MRSDAPRLVRKTVIDFSSLRLPEDVRLALAEAFWGHYGVHSADTIKAYWFHVRTFERFAGECSAIEGLTDMNRGMLTRYIEWLNTQCGLGGKPWSKWRRAASYSALRKLLQWLARCRPGVIPPIEFPFSPFPGRDRDAKPAGKLPARQLRAILDACEADIVRVRALRAASIEPCLYPRSESLLPYYLAILIHTAGNPQAIVELQCDCLQPVPLLDDRQVLLWRKGRTPHLQRRTFSTFSAFEPPALVREILQWSERLRPLAPAALCDRLFLFKSKGPHAVTALSASIVKYTLKRFCARHALPAFCLASIRPSVLSAFYRTSGDLRQVKAVANHASIATTVRYVQAPEVQALNRTRVAALQNAFVGHVGKHREVERIAGSSSPANAPLDAVAMLPPVQAVSFFGFDCKDPLAGTAPGTRRGELCTNFLGCFTCPNAIITPDASNVARLLQARDHLRAAASTLHPARWDAVYAPLLRILEEDILARFKAEEVAAAEPRLAQLAPLPPLR